MKSLIPKAMRRLRLLLELDPDNDKAHFTAALLATDSGRFQLARDYFDRALQVLQPVY